MKDFGEVFTDIILFLFLTVSVSASVKTPDVFNQLKFEQFTSNNGLSQNTVYDIVQDKKGFIWLATQDGLNRYDGYDFTVYRHDGKTGSISTSFVISILPVSDGSLWITSMPSIINIYTPEKDTFALFDFSSRGMDYPPGTLTSLYEDSMGTMWFAFSDGSVYFMSSESGELQLLTRRTDWGHIFKFCQCSSEKLLIGTEKGLFVFDTVNGTLSESSISVFENKTISVIFKDNTGDVWVGTSGGTIFRYNSQIDHFEMVAEFNAYYLTDMAVDRSGILWLSTVNGLFRLVPGTGRVSRFSHAPDIPYSLPTDRLLSLFIDSSGVLWTGTEGLGVSKCSSTDMNFTHMHSIYRHSGSLISNMVFSIMEDRYNNLWIGTGDRGIQIFNSSSDSISVFSANCRSENALMSDFIDCFLESSDGSVWIGTRGGGLSLFNRETRGFVNYLNNPENPNSLSDNIVHCISESGNHPDILWIGTARGLDMLDVKSARFKHYMWTREGQDVGIKVICPSRNGFFWLGTLENGLIRFDPITGKSFFINSSGEKTHSVSDNGIFSLYEDKDGILWIGTAGGGLNSYSYENGGFSYFTVSDGLPNNTVYEILEDDSGHLWLSTNMGLSCFDRQLKTFVNYGIQEGIQHSEFNSGAAFKSRDGAMYFGGINGITKFYPEKIKLDPSTPDTVITDFKIINRQQGSPGMYFDQAVSYAQTIRLTYKENFFRISFIATDFKSPILNRFQYILEGYDEQCHQTEPGDRTAEYTKVPPGNYVFKVKGAGKNGKWSDIPAVLRLEIIPPFWMTDWFRWMAGSILFSGIILLHKMRVRSIRNRSRKLQIMNDALNSEVEQRKEAECRLIQLEEKFRNMIEQSPFSIVMFNTDGSVFSFNESFKELWLLDDEACSRFVSEYNVFKDSLFQEAGVMPQLEMGFKGDRISLPVLRYSPQLGRNNDDSAGLDAWIIHHFYSVTNENNEVISVVMVQEDISDKKLAEDDQKRLIAAIEQADEMIVILDRDRRIKYVNSAYDSMTGLKRAHLFGEYFENINGGFQEKTLFDDILSHLNEGHTWKGNIPLRRKSGDVIDTEVSVSEISDEHDAVYSYIAVFRDVSELKKLENQVRQSQKMEAIGTLAGGIAHDFNNILAPILGYTELLMDSAQDEDHEMKDALSMIMKSTCRARDLIKQILTFSRKGKQEKIHMKLKTIVNEALDLIRASLPAGIRIERDFERSDSLILADPVQVHQIIMNLCTNSYHAMGDRGGVLTVVIQTLTVSPEDREIEVSPGLYQMVSVSDTGSGIKQEVIEKIFDPFFTTKEKGEGTGLGLSTVHGIVKDHGGKISVYSEEGAGTTFKILFPVVESAVQEELPEFDELPRGEETVLLVDDESDIIRIQKIALESLGYTVASADNSEDAFALFNSRMNYIDLVITDMSMPYLNGKDLTRLIRHKRKDIPVILTTGFIDKRNVPFVREMGVSEILMKPVLRMNLAKAVRRALDNK